MNWTYRHTAALTTTTKNSNNNNNNKKQQQQQRQRTKLELKLAYLNGKTTLCPCKHTILFHITDLLDGIMWLKFVEKELQVLQLFNT